MFGAEEIEAIVVGLALLQRTGDAGLQAAARTIGAKIGEMLPDEPSRQLRDNRLFVSGWGISRPAAADLRTIRRAIRDERKLRIAYADERARLTRRTIRPLAVIYYVEVVVLAAWCELRSAFRHFRVDRMRVCKPLKSGFPGQGEKLRSAWQALHRVP
jgi:predicted DNA-binding transcriptional regulator YafY